MTTTKVPRVGTPRENHATIRRPERTRTRYDGLGQRRERLERAGTIDRTNERTTRRDAILFSFRNRPLRTVRRSPRGRGAEEAEESRIVAPPFRWICVFRVRSTRRRATRERRRTEGRRVEGNFIAVVHVGAGERRKRGRRRGTGEWFHQVSLTARFGRVLEPEDALGQTNANGRGGDGRWMRAKRDD
jgi:hypothetical protein